MLVAGLRRDYPEAPLAGKHQGVADSRRAHRRVVRFPDVAGAARRIHARDWLGQPTSTHHYRELGGRESYEPGGFAGPSKKSSTRRRPRGVLRAHPKSPHGCPCTFGPGVCSHSSPPGPQVVLGRSEAHRTQEHTMFKSSMGRLEERSAEGEHNVLKHEVVGFTDKLCIQQ